MSVNGSFLDKNGLTYLWSNLKTLINSKASTSDIYGLPSNSISEQSDLNNFTSPGIYTCLTSATAATLSNAPTSAGFRLEVLGVISNNSYQLQKVFPNNSTGEFFMRRRISGGWSDWTRFASDVNVYLIGTALNTNDDLDNYTTAGRYYAGSSVSASISNKPVTSTYGFQLTVEQNTLTTRYIQTITYNTSNELHIGKIYKRWYTSNGWSVWYVYEGTPITSS